MASDLYNLADDHDFADALIDHIEQEANNRRQILLDNDLYEHSAE